MQSDIDSSKDKIHSEHFKSAVVLPRRSSLRCLDAHVLQLHREVGTPVCRIEMERKHSNAGGHGSTPSPIFASTEFGGQDGRQGQASLSFHKKVVLT